MNSLVDSSAWIEYFKGNQKYSFINDLIAQNCMQNELNIIIHDKHFEVMAKYIPLEIYKLVLSDSLSLTSGPTKYRHISSHHPHPVNLPHYPGSLCKGKNNLPVMPDIFRFQYTTFPIL